MEDVTSGRRLTEVAGRVSPKKPVIALKTGRTEAGKKAVSSHTASMAGNDEINSAAFRQSGIIRARDNEHLFSLMRAFSKQPLPKGPGVFVVTYTGSLGVAATDMLYTRGLKLADLDTRSKDRLAPYLDDYLNVQNPLDCSFSMDASQARELIRIGVESPDVHAVIVIVQGEILDSYVEALASIDYRGKPVLCCVACKEFMMTHVIKWNRKAFPYTPTPEMAVEVLRRCNRHGRRRAAARLADLNGFLAARSFEIAGRKFTSGCSHRTISPSGPTTSKAALPPVSVDAHPLTFCSYTRGLPAVNCVLDPEEGGRRGCRNRREGDSRKLVAIARLISAARPARPNTPSSSPIHGKRKRWAVCSSSLPRPFKIPRRPRRHAEICRKTSHEQGPSTTATSQCNAKERNMLLMVGSLEIKDRMNRLKPLER